MCALAHRCTTLEVVFSVKENIFHGGTAAVMFASGRILLQIHQSSELWTTPTNSVDRLAFSIAVSNLFGRLASSWARGNDAL